MKFRNWYIILVLSLFCFDAISQDREHYSFTDGLVHNYVSTLYQDSFGYIWIGTWDGLSRFDGHSFTSYKHIPNDSLSIHGDQVHKILEDKKGSLWVLTRNGLSRFDRQSEKFIRVGQINPSESLNPGNQIRQFFFDQSNRIWLLTKYQLYVFNPENGNSFFIDIADIYSKDGFMLQEDKDVWLVSSQGLYLFDQETLCNKKVAAKSMAIKSIPLNAGKQIDGFTNLFRISNGSLLTRLNMNDIMLINPQSGSYEILSDRDHLNLANWGSINCIEEIDTNQLWLSSDNLGIQIYNLTKGALVNNKMLDETIGIQTVYSTFRDKQDNIWIGTLNGLYKYSLPLLKYDSWDFNLSNKTGIDQNRVFALDFDEANNTLWVGSKGGGLKKVKIETNEIIPIQLPFLDSDHSANNVSCIYVLNQDELLLGSDTLLMKYNHKTGNSELFKPVSMWARTIFRDKDNRLWIIDLDSLTIAEERAGSYSYHSIPHSGFLPFRNYVGSVVQDKRGQIWLGSAFGLVRYNEKNPASSVVFGPPGSEADPQIFGLCESDDGTLWMGTIRNGMYGFDLESQKFIHHFCDTTGLINNSVYAIVDDGQGYLWLSTQSGVSQFNLQNHNILNFSGANGLPFHDFTAGAFCKANNGKIYFGGEGGVIGFLPDSFIQSQPETPLVIHSIHSKHGQLPFSYPLTGGEEIVLANEDNSVEINFGCLDFRFPDTRAYRYKLSGVNKDWVQVQGNEMAARYYNLNPGHYFFTVESTYENCSWTRENLKMAIEVENKVFWQRDGFILSTIAALLFALIAALLLRLKNINMKKEMRIVRLEREANLSTLNFLKTQMNPHFIFNTLSAINSFVLQNNIRSANKYLTTFATLMREILESSKNEFVTVESEISSLRKYLLLQQLRFPEKFEFEFKVRPEVLIKKIPPMLIQPFIENTVEHAFKEMKVPGLLVVEFLAIENSLICVVKDNGVGMKEVKAKPRQGHRESTAIKNIRERINILQKIYKTEISLDIRKASPENNEFPGTLIELKLPDFGKTDKKTT
ncbi:MAG: histidine kinase [Bacteroidales bacterium]|nr:histidine kinase [Bacteroidales bacterium]MCF8455870.1 histidine kinase [Bacteroidales bacterium]